MRDRSGATGRSRLSSLGYPIVILAAFVACPLLTAADLRTADTGPRDGDSTFGVDEGQTILRIIRGRTTPDAAALIPSPLPRLVGDSLRLPLIVSFYHNGPTPFQHVAKHPTLLESSEEAGDRLRRFFSQAPDGDRILREGRIHVDIVTGRKRIGGTNRTVIAQSLVPGLDGLVCTGEFGEVYFTPLTVLRHERALDRVKAMYIAQESSMPPDIFAAERMMTASYVEETPGGKALPLYRGRVLRQQPQAWEMAEAMSRAGVWLLTMQRPDGSFPPTYHPADEKRDEATVDWVEHVRVAEAITMLHQLLGDERILAARESALRLAIRSLREEKRESLAYLPTKDDPVTASALLLNVLCRPSLAESAPAATGPMRYLGEFLCVMTSPDGCLYTSLSNARAKRPPYVVKGEPYAEALIALTLLQRVSPTKKTAEAAERLAARIGSLPASLPRIAPNVRAWPRTIEALAEYYKLTWTERYGRAALDLAERLVGHQGRPGKGDYPDYEGGFAQPDLPPDTILTAASACALAAAYDVGNLMREPVTRFSVGTRRAAAFLMNMQYRTENDFFLRHPELIHGALRRSPEDLSVHSPAVGEATRALILAATVTAETTPPVESLQIE